MITVAPLFMIWFGFEPLGKIVIVAVFGVFPIAVQTARGLTAVPQFYEDVALTCGATRAWALWHVKLRVAARQIFGGIRISPPTFSERRPPPNIWRNERPGHLAASCVQFVPHSADLLRHCSGDRRNRNTARLISLVEWLLLGNGADADISE